ncbi:MAG: hypothetical protein AAF666_02810 [Pseudomonadota bacterium]
MAERASPFATPATGQAAGVRLYQQPRGSLWQVAAWPDTFNAVDKSLAMACGCDAPGPGQIIPTDDGRKLIRIEPLKWWIMGPDGADCPLRPEPEEGAWLDMSHDQAGIALEGENAAEILKRMVSLDLREAAFPTGRFATTQMHHMITRVLRRDTDVPRYEVMVMRSYADDLREIAQHHLAHLG